MGIRGAPNGAPFVFVRRTRYDGQDMATLVNQLAAPTDSATAQRRVLVAPSLAWGREALATLARQRGGWVGWSATTVDALAAELSYTELARRRLRRVGVLEQQMLLDDAISRVQAQLPPASDLALALARDGARHAVRESIDELRMAGLRPAPSPAGDTAPLWTMLSGIAAEYATTLSSRPLVDGADLFELALAADDAAWHWFADTQFVLADLQSLTGLRARLRDALSSRGAVTLESGPAGGGATRTAFVAATPVDELRELLRRIVALGVPFEEVEIVSTDDDSYAIALDSVCTSLGLHASMTRGLPFAATRIGRVVLGWLDDFTTDAVETSPKVIAGDLLLRLDALPTDPGSPDETNRVRCADELRSVVSALEVQMAVPRAVEMVREVVASLRGWTSVSGGGRPRHAGGVPGGDAVIGRVHLTTLAQAGLSGRRVCAVVGLDAERTRGPMIQSAVLPDALRVELSPALLTTSARRVARSVLVTQAITRAAEASERLFLSYATTQGGGSREAGPSHALLDAVRQDDATITDYAVLRTRLGAPVGAVPLADAPALDARDVWFAALSRDGLLLDGSELIGDTLDGLRAGMARQAALGDPTAVEAHGQVSSARGAYDVRDGDESVSPTSLETMGSCGLRWFYRYVLGVEPSIDATDDPDRWLDAASRGALLHGVFAEVVRAGWLRTREGDRAAVEASAVGLADRLLERHRDEVRPPSAAVFMAERDAFVEDVRHFIRHEWREQPVATLAVEQRFGGRRERVPFVLPDGSSVWVQGSIDRADALADGTIRIIDYKTGRAPVVSLSDPPAAGGRRLQLPLYASAAEALLRATVSAAELRCPTVIGGGEVVAMREEDRAAAPAVVQSLLESAADGAFLPTDDAKDCRYCEYTVVCRVSVSRFGEVTSPRAEWAKQALTSEPPPVALVRQAKRRAAVEE
jgi:RecB family exonuclease